MRTNKNKHDLELLVTLWPTFPHFERFSRDGRLGGIRLNSAMVSSDVLENELEYAKSLRGSVPLYFDVKGRQLRVKEVIPSQDHLEIVLNHPIKVKTPSVVLFKAGTDPALLEKVEDNHLIFQGGPKFLVYEGESLHLKHPSLEVGGSTFSDYEISRIAKAKKAGFDKFFLSYVECQKDIDNFREHVGDSEIIAKIENKKGLDYVANEFRKKDNLSLMAARGDLYIELDRPHHMIDALQLIISKDPEASIGSRLLLSVTNNPVPECCDLLEMAWMYDKGYKKMMLCDGLCLKEEPLARAINVFESFRQSYTEKKDAKYKSPSPYAFSCLTDSVMKIFRK